MSDNEIQRHGEWPEGPQGPGVVPQSTPAFAPTDEPDSAASVAHVLSAMAGEVTDFDAESPGPSMFGGHEFRVTDVNGVVHTVLVKREGR